jgi:DNA-binding transcriptional MerR regulator
MKSSNDVPIYNLKAVVQETGLKPDTLRAWERRYGLPAPQRTDSGHRLYSQNDIDLLKWFIARQDEGMSISRAVELWRRLEAENPNPLQPTAALGSPAQTPPMPTMAPALHNAAPIQGSGIDIMSQLRATWLQSCLAFNEQRAEQILAHAFALFPVEQVCTEVLQKGLAEIGIGWYEGIITVQQEHFASVLVTRRLEALLAATPPPTRNGRIMIGCPPDEAHTFVPLLLTLLLRRRGWDVLFLGANVPIQDFIGTIQTAQPQLVVLTAQVLATAVGVRDLGELIYEIGVPMAYGGLVFTQVPAICQSITGHYLGDTVQEGKVAIETMMNNPRLPKMVGPRSTRHEDALQQFLNRHREIELEVERSFGGNRISTGLLRGANSSFSRDIVAALALGDIHHLGPDLPWVKGLLQNHYRLPESLVTDFLQAYATAAERVLRSSDSSLLQWLHEILEEKATEA